MDLSGASREQLLAELARRDVEIVALVEKVAEQHTRIVELVEKVAELSARLGRDSSNSSRPPSSDPPYRKKPKRGLRGSSGRKPGKQPGAPGAALRQVDDPDEVVVCELVNCPGCGRSLVDAPVASVARRQVFDPPPAPVRPHVTEYRILTRRCGCGARVAGSAPAGALAPVSYGPRTAALAVYLGAGQYLPVARTAGSGHPDRGVAPSTGWLLAQRAQAARLLEAFLPRVRGLLRTVGVLHVDETPGRQAQLRPCGLHRVPHRLPRRGPLRHQHRRRRCAARLYRRARPGRGYAGYTHPIDAAHAWCGAHSLRDLHAVYDAGPERQPWAKALAGTLLEANAAAQAARDAGLTAIKPSRLATIVNHYRGASAKGIADNDGRNGALAREALTLAGRFRSHEHMILRFATDLAVPLTNNQAERDCLPVKVQQRASGGCWRTLQGLADFAVVQSYLSTAHKWGKDSLDVLHQLFTTGAWLPPVAAPT